MIKLERMFCAYCGKE